MIQGVLVHLENELPVLVDLDEMPGPNDNILRCTNVRGVDGKRPQFVHDRKSTFLLPMKMVRLIEVPHLSTSQAVATQDEPDYRAHEPEPEQEPELDTYDEEAEEDLLARIRSI